MKVIINFEKEIESCSQCPFAHNIYEQGYNATECVKLGCYKTIPKQGIRKDCPFKRGE